MSENAGKEKVQITMSKKIIGLKNCSVTTQEPEDAKERNNAIRVSDHAGNENVQIPFSEKIIRLENSPVSMSFL